MISTLQNRTKIFVPAKMERPDVSERCGVCKGPLVGELEKRRKLCWICNRLRISAEREAE